MYSTGAFDLQHRIWGLLGALRNSSAQGLLSLPRHFCLPTITPILSDFVGRRSLRVSEESNINDQEQHKYICLVYDKVLMSEFRSK